MDPGFLPAMLLFCVEPTDRALEGWCAAPVSMDTEQRAADYVYAAASHGCAFYGRSVA